VSSSPSSAPKASPAKANPKKRSATDATPRLVYDESSSEDLNTAPAPIAKSSDGFDGAKRRKVAEIDIEDEPAPKAPVAVPAPAPKPAPAAGKPISFPYSSLNWSQQGSLFVYSAPNFPGSSLIAAFDMDSTLIEPSSGRKIPSGRGDWRMWHASVPEKLKQLMAQGYKIVVFTNQGYKEDAKHKEMMGKFTDIINSLKIPIQIFMAGAKDQWRKPNTSMWDLFVSKHNAGVAVDFAQSFYCGDAAGRVAGWKPGAKKDFSCSDRKFAHNNGLVFKMPEELFLGQANVAATKFIWDGIDPNKALETAEAKSDVTKQVIQKAIGARKTPEMVILVGCPASGKSSFSNRYLVPLGYVRVNRDTLGDQNKCLAAARQAFQQGKSVVVDNTNPGVDARSKYIELAKQFGAPVRAFVMGTSRELAEHLNLVREKMTKGATKRIPDIAYNTYFKNHAVPSTAEGISSVVTIDWLPEFANAQERKLFLQFT
jgi:bifunctional polynucleotide phosphatase/kinase